MNSLQGSKKKCAVTCEVYSSSRTKFAYHNLQIRLSTLGKKKEVPGLIGFEEIMIITALMYYFLARDLLRERHPRSVTENGINMTDILQQLYQILEKKDHPSEQA